MKERIIKELSDKSVLILGFGREGKSTYNFIKSNNIRCKLGIADKSDIKDDEINNNSNIRIHVGEDYLKSIYDYDIVIKSPGISFRGEDYSIFNKRITSQTELFLKYASKKTIGVTGTKGKSTTSSLIYNMLKCKYNVELVGNIGRPVFNEIDNYDKTDFYIYELSSHQLEHTRYSPHIAVLLNIFEEHLDHYDSYDMYKEAKRNIFKYQTENDYYIYNYDMQDVLNEKREFKQNIVGITNNAVYMKHENKVIYSKKQIYINLKNFNYKIDIPLNEDIHGIHNIYNISTASTVAKILDVDTKDIAAAIANFKTLPHRLQKIGKYKNIVYIDDSISTIPEATIFAINSIDNVDTVLIGGKDRGVNYNSLIQYIAKEYKHNVILMYDSGKRIYNELKKIKCLSNIIYVENIDQAVKLAIDITEEGKVCILSPAAASYGWFKNFEERGDKFKELVIKYTSI